MNGLKLQIQAIAFVFITMTFPVYAGDINSELLAAVQAGNIDAVKALLEKGADVNAKDESGATALILAVKKGDVNLVRILLRKGADVNIKQKHTVRANDSGRIFDGITNGAKPLYNLKHITGGGWSFSTFESSTSVLRLAAEEGHANIITTLMAYGADDIPNFVWPPPKPSASTKIPSKFLLNQNGKTLLKDLAGKLENSFSEAGYSDIAYYRVPDGFALVSKLEQINTDGTPKDPRWSSDIAASRIFNLTSYIKALFTASPGQYRIIAFIVTSKRFVPSSETIKREEAMAWLDNGMKALPKKIGKEDYTDEHYCTALIYEFEQPGRDKEPFLKDSSKSRLSGKEHLEKSSLWSKLEK